MSPEQARGRSVDRRADIWSFGAILWEMVTGNRLFEGETVSDTLAAVLRADPDWDQLPADEAPQLCRLIERCLVRDPQQRLRDIGEARIFLQDGGGESSLLSIPSMSAAALSGHDPAPSGVRWPMVVLIGVLMLAAGAVAGWKLLSTTREAQVFHAMLNERDAFEAEAAQLLEEAPSWAIRGTIANIYARLGEYDRAEELLRELLDQGNAGEVTLFLKQSGVGFRELFSLPENAEFRDEYSRMIEYLRREYGSGS
jgi:hypothetical protein